ncbi:GNAT family N-acetyltransferase [Georgenia yuyongxinii]|uniref:GNAT family N-acetyltransferase n=1 Tax=Georgenia yuyongxinii TaxID=2589797 RepID=A0A552WWE3_9MICO|nr:GNAT family N-acetyltransferase [Georgenia yuyongxinii]TRW47148.1 GNAT family N-acetyltransferase [Georgenia yuyongxinii]
MPSDRLERPLAERLHVPDTAEVPAPHLGLSWRRLDGTDVSAVLGLLERCAAVDRAMMRLCPVEIAARLGGATGMVTDSLGGFAPDGELRAMAMVYLPPHDTAMLRAFVTATIDPEWRGRGIGRALLDWQDARARQLLAEDGRDLPARIGAYVGEHLADRRKLYVAGGFSSKRVYQEMRRPVSRPVPEVTLPTGLRLVDWSRELDDAVRQTHNEAYAEHWGAQPFDPESWSVVHPELAPGWSKVVLAPRADGDEVVAFAMTSRHEHSWRQLGFSEGYTEQIGVRRDHRGKGLARALLAEVIRALAADGIESSALVVDTVTEGTHRFYEELGYQRQGAQILYTIEI